MLTGEVVALYVKPLSMMKMLCYRLFRRVKNLMIFFIFWMTFTVDSRNDFIHFSRKGWSIELIELPSVVLRCVEVAKFLAFDSFNTIWHDGELRSRAESAFTFLISELKSGNHFSKDILFKQ